MQNNEVITHALRMLGVIRANAQPTAEHSQLGLAELNAMMAEFRADEGIDLGYYRQTDVSDEIPISDDDAETIKPILAVYLRIHFPAAEPTPDLGARAEKSHKRLTRDAVLTNMVEADLSNLPSGSARRRGNILTG